VSPLPGSTHLNPKSRHCEPIDVKLDVERHAIASSSNHLALFHAFWILGLLNDASYVIMIACAKNVSQGGTGLVFLANVVPSLGVKVSSPWWFDQVGHDARMTT
jgi:hypothetical protein